MPTCILFMKQKQLFVGDKKGMVKREGGQDGRRGNERSVLYFSNLLLQSLTIRQKLLLKAGPVQPVFQPHIITINAGQPELIEHKARFCDYGLFEGQLV